MAQTRKSWDEQVVRASMPSPADSARPGSAGVRVAPHWAVDAVGCLLAAALGLLVLASELRAGIEPLQSAQLGIDLACGALACLSLWRRRRWPLGVALACAVLGTVSISATPAGLLALFSLAVHRPFRPALLVTALWVPSVLLFAAYSPRTEALSVVLTVTPLALAATAWGMYVRARRQLLLTLRERALHAEADRQRHGERARMAERERIAREMHDVLAHRMSLVALHAGGLEVRPDLPPEEVRRTAELLRSTARQALEELREVIGVLREEPGQEQAPSAPQPTLSDLPRLVEDRRQAGATISFEMRVERPETVPSALGRDVYRIVQESLTNLSKHAHGTVGRVSVTGAADHGLRVRVRNRLPVDLRTGPTLPGSGSGLLGLTERVTLAGGTLMHGPDGSGDFVVDAELPW